MPNGNLISNWSFKRKLPEPFEDYTDDPIRKDVYSKYCTQPQKRSTLHASTLRAILAYMELENRPVEPFQKNSGQLAARGIIIQ